MIRHRLKTTLVAALLGLSAPAYATDATTSLLDLSAEEKAAFLDGLREANGAFDAGRFDEALLRYDTLLARVAVAEVYFRRGACLERLARPAEAAAAYRRYLELAPAARDAGRVQFDIERLEAAAREAAQAPPQEVAEPKVPEAPASAPPAPTPAPEPAPRDDAGGPRTLAWTLTGSAGVLGLGAGVLAWFTASTIDEANDYDRRAPGNSRSGLAEIQDRARNLETAFWVTGGVALAAGLAAGVVFLLDDPRSPGVGSPAALEPTPAGFILRF